MRKFIFGILMAALFYLVPAFAQDLIQPPSVDELQGFLASLGGLQGASVMGFIVLGIQGVLFLFRTGFGQLIGKYKLLVIYTLSMLLAPLYLIHTGVSPSLAFVHGNTLAAVQVFLNQIFKQFVTKTD